MVPLVINAVAPGAVWYGICPVRPAVSALVEIEVPVSEPTKVVLVTLVKPDNVVAVAPSDTLVDPIVILLFVKPAFGILVIFAPDIVGELVQVGAVVPVDCNIWFVVPAAVNPVVLAAD